METIKTTLAIIGGVAVIATIFLFVRTTIALWKYNPNDFYKNH